MPKTATMLVTVGRDGAVIDAIGTDGDEDFLQQAIPAVLQDLQPPGPPPGAAPGTADFLEAATVTCSPPGIFPPLPPYPSPAFFGGQLTKPVRWLEVQFTDTPPVSITFDKSDHPRMWLETTVDGRVKLLGRDRGTLSERTALPLDATAAYVIGQWLYTPGVWDRRFAVSGLMAFTISR